MNPHRVYRCFHADTGKWRIVCSCGWWYENPQKLMVELMAIKHDFNAEWIFT